MVHQNAEAGASEVHSTNTETSENPTKPTKEMTPQPQSMVRQFTTRDAWQRRHEAHPIVALYNTGRSLHIDQHGLDIRSYYSLQWKWIVYGDFLTASYAIVSQNRPGHVLGAVELQHSGHTPTGHVQISVRKDSGRMEPYLIPPMHILYLALTPGRVCDTLMVQQPLPMRLFPRLYEYRLIPVSL